MTQEFERCRRDVRGKGVTITSWFDDRTGTWNASAPDYAYLLAISGNGHGASSRNSAIERVVNALANRSTANG